MLRQIIKRIDEADGQMVTLTKPLVRVAFYELLRLLEKQPKNEADKAKLIQQLTMEYACAHIVDLLQGLIHSIDDGSNADVAPRALLRFAINEIKALGRAVEVETEGKA